MEEDSVYNINEIIRENNLHQKKSCLRCQNMKDISFFYKKKRGLLGVDSKCKQCVLLLKNKSYKKTKRAKSGIIEVVDDESLIPEKAILIFSKYLRIT